MSNRTMRTEKDDLCHDIGRDIQYILQSLLGDKFEVWSTGTINPDFYEGHMKYAEMGGLKLTVTLKDFPHHPTMKQINAYFKRMKE